MWYVYFLKRRDESVYVGHTNDLRERFRRHNEGYVPSTKFYRPLKLKSYIAVETQQQARDLEVYFKSGSGRALFKKRFLPPLDNSF